MAMLGGAGSLWGPIIGAAILVPMRSYLGSWLGGMAGFTGLDILIYGIIIMLIAAVQPRGVWGIVESVRARRKGAA
jgi:branched-chain amino acid transport system permease protein